MTTLLSYNPVVIAAEKRPSSPVVAFLFLSATIAVFCLSYISQSSRAHLADFPTSGSLGLRVNQPHLSLSSSAGTRHGSLVKLFASPETSPSLTSVHTFADPQPLHFTEATAPPKNPLAVLSTVAIVAVLSGVNVLRKLQRRSGHAFAAPLAPIGMLAATSSADIPEVDRTFTLPAPAIFSPFIGTGVRRTVCTELVQGVIWGFEQSQELSSLSVNIRCTVIKLSDGGLWVHAPVFPTNEFLNQLNALGPVRYIILPTYALEHKLPVITFAQRYPAAQVWAVPDTWSWPINLPLSMLGIRVHGLIGKDRADWSNEFEMEVLKIDDVGSPFVEVAFLHKATKTLLVTDLLYCIPSVPPTVVDPAKLLDVAPDDPTQPLADSPEARQQGWAKMALLVSYFIPARQRLVKGGKAEWQPGYMNSFHAIAGTVIVSPILQALVLAKSKNLIMPWLEKVLQWDFERLVPAHYDAPVPATAAEVRAAFGFVTGDIAAMQLPEEDMRTLNELQAIVKKASTGEGEVYTELFDKFFKNLFIEKPGWVKK